NARGRPPKRSKPWALASAARWKGLELQSVQPAAPTPEVETSEDAPPPNHSRISPLFETRSRIVPDHAAATTEQETEEPSETQQQEDDNSLIFPPLPSEPEDCNARQHPIPQGRGIFAICSVVSAIQVFKHGNVGTKESAVGTSRCHPDSYNESYPIDEAISLASSAVPIRYEDIRSLFTILDLTPPTKTSFGSRCRKKIGSQMDTALQKSLEEAGNEDWQLTLRSYGHSYNSKYGNAAIIGVSTKKVLFAGKRVMACRMCQINSKSNKESPHTCFKNWAGPSTAMEADIVYEGFSKSIQQHGLVYAYFVADGDSSTYSPIKDLYGGITVQKIECINHRRYISKEGRSLPRAESRFKRIGLAVQSACRYYRDLRNWECNWKDFRQEEDLVDQFKTKPLFLEVADAIDRVASLARSLIRRENSNIVECYFSVCAKYLEGKRKNLGTGSLCHQRISAATFSFNNSKFWAADFYKMIHCKSHCAKWKLEMQRSVRLRHQPIKYRKPRIISFPFLKAGRGDDHYGSNPDRPDLTEETLQSNSDLWKRERRIRITASNAKWISSMQDSTDNYAILRQLLSQAEFSTPSTLYGHAHETDAIAEYENSTGNKVRRCGLVVSLEDGRLPVSPDGKVGDEGLLEVKCPLTLKDKKILDWAKVQRSQSPVVLKDGVLIMKTEHAHYFQVVMQIFVTEREWCDSFIWSETGDYFLQ
ncbi:Exonuclease, partial [Orchesella cincta]